MNRSIWIAAAALLIASAPQDASACSWRPFVADHRLEGVIPTCVDTGTTSDLAPSQREQDWGIDEQNRPTNLWIRSHCTESLTVRIDDCVHCGDDPEVLRPLTGDGSTAIVRDVGIFIDETVGQDIPVVVGWELGEESGEFTVVIEMADVHPDDQDDGGCGLSCSVGRCGPEGAGLMLLLLAAGGLARRRAS